MRSYSYPPRRRRIGCLGWLLIIVVFLAVAYWLFFSPIKPGSLAGPAFIDGQVSDPQQTAIAKMAEKSAERPSILADSGQIQYLNADVPVGKAGDSPQERAYLFLEQNRQVYQIKEPRSELKFTGKTTDEARNTYVRFVQQHRGVEVYGSGVVVTVKKAGRVTAVGSNYVPNLSVDVKNKIQQAQANQIVLKDLNAEGWKISDKSLLQIYAPFIGGDHTGGDTPALAWIISASNQMTGEDQRYFINAYTGEILAHMSSILEVGGKIDLEIWEEKNNLLTLIGGPAEKAYRVMDENGRIEGQSPTGYSLDAYKNSRHIYNYYWDTFSRDSYDGKGAVITILVNITDCSKREGGWNRAFWSPGLKIIYFCNAFSGLADVMDHEFTHAVVGSFVSFDSSRQPRELGESLADIFAAFSSSDGTFWVINGPNNSVSRNLQSPEKGFPQKYSQRYCEPFHLFCCPRISSYQDSYDDCGHVNSVVFSHAAYLMSSDSEDGSIPREKLQYLFYEVLRTHQIQSYTDQKSAARAVLSTCQNIRGQASTIEGKNLSSPFTEADCEGIERAFQETELIPVPPVPLPPIKLPDLSKWIQQLQQSLRDWFDQNIGDLRQKIADYLQKLLQDLVNMTEQKLLELLNQILLDILNFLVRLAKSCMGSLVLTGLVPFLTLALYHRRE